MTIHLARLGVHKLLDATPATDGVKTVIVDLKDHTHTAPNFQAPRHPHYGPARVIYREFPDGGINTTIEELSA